MSAPYIVDGLSAGAGGGLGGGVASAIGPLAAPQPGQINGRVVDAGGAPIPGVTIVVEAGGQRQNVVSGAARGPMSCRTCRTAGSR